MAGSRPWGIFFIWLAVSIPKFFVTESRSLNTTRDKYLSVLSISSEFSYSLKIVCLKGQVPAPNDVIRRQALHDGFTTEELGAEYVAEYAFVVMKINCEQTPLKISNSNRYPQLFSEIRWLQYLPLSPVYYKLPWWRPPSSQEKTLDGVSRTD